ncbi:signal peptidase I [Candidatus Gracilibacteria bacterium]|nr:signal peptidase I [Candidatus Gracilibacteria bacterium]NUJ98436.1 signal peptidase I [Candidatus Gracilibacteria bacterium]
MLEETITPNPDEDTSQNTENEKRDFKKESLDFIKDLGIILIIVLIIRTFLILPFQINGQSMYDSYYDKEFIIVDRFSYILGSPHRGDVIVFRPHVSEEREYFIKRVIGLAGDKIKIKDGKVYLWNQDTKKYNELNEVYLSESNEDSTFVRGDSEEYEYTVPEDSYFVMGDNRLASTDSRTCFSSCLIEGKSNYIGKKDIIGKVFIDLGYFNIRSFSFVHPTLGIETVPRFLGSPSHADYNK